MSLMDIVSTETFMEEKIPNIYKFCAPTSVSLTKYWDLVSYILLFIIFHNFDI